jgi:putative ABC transport system permease protein
VQTVSTLSSSQAKVVGVGGKPRISGLDTHNADEVLNLDFQDGTSAKTLQGLTNDEAIATTSFLDANDLNVGDKVVTLGQTGKLSRFRIVGSLKDNANLLGSLVVNQKVMGPKFGTNQDLFDFIKLDPGADADAVQAKIKPILRKQFPTSEVLNQDELKSSQEASINPLLGLVYALLGLAVIVSLFGIANALALSIYERRRELGMLRAVGMSRRQVRTLIRYEAVITALIGAVIGMVIGMIFAALMSVPLASQGFVISYPVGQLIFVLIIAALAGVLAAIAPARRAAKLDVLEALAYE